MYINNNTCLKAIVEKLKQSAVGLRKGFLFVIAHNEEAVHVTHYVHFGLWFERNDMSSVGEEVLERMKQDDSDFVFLVDEVDGFGLFGIRGDDVVPLAWAQFDYPTEDPMLRRTTLTIFPCSIDKTPPHENEVPRCFDWLLGCLQRFLERVPTCPIDDHGMNVSI